MKNVKHFHLKIIIFKAVKNCNVLHRCVFVMISYGITVFKIFIWKGISAEEVYRWRRYIVGYTV